jgi:type IV secretory pathway TrbD component
MALENRPVYRPVYRALHRPLTVAGVDRRLFFLALLVGAAAFNLCSSLLAGAVLFAMLYGLARWASAHDPEMPRILLRSAGRRARYDAAKPAGKGPRWSA